MDIRRFFGGSTGKATKPKVKKAAVSGKETTTEDFFSSFGAGSTAAASTPATVSQSAAASSARSPHFSEKSSASGTPGGSFATRKRAATSKASSASKRRRAAVVVQDDDEDDDDDDFVELVEPKRKPKQAGKTATKPAAKAAKGKTATRKRASGPKVEFTSAEAGDGAETAAPKKRAAGNPKFRKAGADVPSVGPGKVLPTGPANALEKLKFVVTGVLPSMGRDEAKAFIERHGGKVTTAVSGATKFLVVGTRLEDGRNVQEGSKYRKAEEKGVPIIDEAKLIQMVVDKMSGAERAAFDAAAKKKEAGAEEEKKAEEERQLAAIAAVSRAPAPRPAKGGVAEERAPRKAPVDPSTMLWVDKHRPKVPAHLVGNAPAIRAVQQWLTRWHAVHLAKTEQVPWSKSNPGSRAVLLSGPPGIGKSSSAALIAKSMGYEVFELNASDTRNKRALKEHVREVVSSRVLDFRGGPSGAARKRVLIMDEVDGVSGNADRGGLPELIAIIAATRTPIICVANDHDSQKMRSLVSACFDVRFSRPTASEMAPRLVQIASAEGMKVDVPAAETLAEAVGGDIRQAINMLQMWKERSPTLSASDLAGQGMATVEKDKVLRVTATEAAAMQMRAAGRRPFDERYNSFFVDYDMIPLFLAQMVPSTVASRFPRTLKGPALSRCADTLARAAEAVSDADLVAAPIRAKQRWNLLTSYAALNLRIGARAAGTPGMLFFPEWLGKNSTAGKSRRLLNELAMHSRMSTRCGANGMRLDYMAPLREAFVRPLCETPPDAAATVAALDEYGLRREDFVDGMHQFVFKDASAAGKSRSKKVALHPCSGLTFESVESKAKAAFTRTYNKTSHRAQSTAVTGQEKASDFAVKKRKVAARSKRK